ncbi:hypothetical protein VTI28DRAFT_4075 [Corynascus sepedonium]
MMMKHGSVTSCCTEDMVLEASARAMLPWSTTLEPGELDPKTRSIGGYGRHSATCPDSRDRDGGPGRNPLWTPDFGWGGSGIEDPERD